MHCRWTSGLFQRFSFSMIKRRENESGKAFFGFFTLFLQCRVQKLLRNFQKWLDKLLDPYTGVYTILP